MAEAKKVVNKQVSKTKKNKDEQNGAIEKDVTTKNQADTSKKELETVKEPAVKVAKAGKRSVKAIKETEEKLAKESRKSKAEVLDTEATKVPKQVQTSRTKLERRSKSYRKLAELIDKDKDYTLEQALKLASETSSVKFDATIELHVNLNVDPRQADQNIRGSLVLPSGTGKTAKVTVIADVDDAKKAKSAGADDAGLEEIFAKLDKGLIDFDILIATPAMMPKLGKYARILGPKGLMPNPKSGTVTTDVAKAVKDSKGGKVEYRVDSTGIIHLGIGKVSFGTEKLLPNAETVINAIRSAKPSSIKGVYVKSIFVSTTMGPSIKVTQVSN